MNNANIAFALDVDLREEDLIALTTAVDQLDSLHMLIDGILFVPEQDRTLEQYVGRATRYLVYLLDRLREDDLRQVSTMPISESQTRRRISRLLRSSTQAVRS